jgi:hypothetical protein
MDSDCVDRVGREAGNVSAIAKRIHIGGERRRRGR